MLMHEFQEKYIIIFVSFIRFMRYVYVPIWEHSERVFSSPNVVSPNHEKAWSQDINV